jgi:poly(A) polymerase
MLLRCESGEVDTELGKWWEAFQRATPSEREAMLLTDEFPRKRRRGKGRRKAVAGDMAGTNSSATDSQK